MLETLPGEPPVRPHAERHRLRGASDDHLHLGNLPERGPRYRDPDPDPKARRKTEEKEEGLDR